ncbi:DnaJ-like protein subfamily B member 11 [Oopsacas minuta]|uniref:DnaJ-like protein subfamily B member 11 n=1 Tax=Oopsacas minuta TaxID=111878 RepID=A0AAV7K450_9METZ|nr:DnaJ-like protein subfamily B member 11 [Oopsacas minuta]
MRIYILVFLVAALLGALLVECGRDFYKILGVSRSATRHQIKKAYRALAMIHHPDRSSDPDSEEKFHDIGAAYEVLNDKEKRKIYDERGEEGLSGNRHGGGDVFSSFFGGFGFGFGGGQRQGHHETPRGADVLLEVLVTLEELYNGEFVEFLRSKPVYQETSGTRKCRCTSKMVTRQLGPGQFQMFPEEVCDSCPNKRLVTEERNLEFEIEPGMSNGQQYRFNGEGEPHIDGDPGDFIVQIQTNKHVIFERKEHDLYTNISITLRDALTGFKMNLTHLDGHKVSVVKDTVTAHGDIITILNEGMPFYDHYTRRGNLYITFEVEFPVKTFSPTEAENIVTLLGQNSEQSAYNGL